MNGAQALVTTLVDCGVEVCFANPGTSEMHVVAALEDVPALRGVLTLFEGVATGAADGYARMARRPAVTLLHLGPGLSNGLANLHNARRAQSPVVNLVGDHARSHAGFDAPLQSDIDTVARGVSGWVRHSAGPADTGSDAAAAVAAAAGPPGQVATLVLPADACWGRGGVVAEPLVSPLGAGVDHVAVAAAAAALRSGEPCLLLIGGDGTGEHGVEAAARIAAATGARLLAETFPARLTRGAGLPAVRRLGYHPDMARHQLTGTAHLILVGARSPVTFFGYPDQPGDLVPPDSTVHPVASRESGAATAALAALAAAVAAGITAPVVAPHRPDLPTGPLTADSAAAVVGALLPAGAIVVDESVTSGLTLTGHTAGAPRHDWLTLTGGAIGYGLAAAAGAAIACPDRPVWCLQADGAAMYAISALWTHAREGLDITTVVYRNDAYAILGTELDQLGLAAPERARELFDLARPRLDFVSIATGMGVPARRVDTAGELADALRRAAAEPGPHLVEAVMAATTS